MADPVGQGPQRQAIAVPTPPPMPAVVVPEAAPRARAMEGEKAIARVLRAGAVLGGGCFAASLGVGLLPASARTGVAIDLLRKSGASLLIVTPVARIAVAGAVLGMKGEPRYLLYGAAILALLGIALGTSLSG